jgi:hypothetical protein
MECVSTVLKDQIFTRIAQIQPNHSLWARFRSSRPLPGLLGLHILCSSPCKNCSQLPSPTGENCFLKQYCLTSNANKMTYNKLFWLFFILRFPTYSSWRLSKTNQKILILSMFFFTAKHKKVILLTQVILLTHVHHTKVKSEPSDRNSWKKVPHNLI